jgi:zinc protease
MSGRPPRCGKIPWRAAVAALLFGLAAPCAAKAADSTVLRATLDNGLRVVIVRNTLAPVATMAVNYLVGANETPPGFPGMAHAQEHMMFRGSPGLSAGQLADIAGLMGGSFNADTRQTVTQYLFTVPASELDVALHIEALRMAGVEDREEGWRLERGAIEQEVARDLSSPTYVLFTRLREALFAGTPYAHDALGTKASFDKTTGAMLKSFHDKWYAPNNAVLIVAGDVDRKATLATVKELFEAIPRKTLPARPRIELQPVVPRTLHLETDLPYGLRVIALRLPGFESSDFGAVEVLADVLNSERGPLYDLVANGKALDVGFSFDPQAKASLGYFTITYPKDGDGEALEAEVRSIVAQVASNGVPKALVTAAKLQERSEAEFQKNSIEGLADVWSEAVAVQGLASPDEDLARIDKVSDADVDRVAHAYLGLDRAVSAVLTPTGSGKPVRGGGFAGPESISVGANEAVALPDWARAALERLSLPHLERQPVVSRLPNGLTLVVQPEDVSDTVSVYGHVRNRPELQVPKGKEGLSQVLDHMYDYGTEHMGRASFQTALDEIGAQESAGVDFSVKALADKFDRAVALLADHELHPAFTARDLAAVKSALAGAVAGRLESPGYLAERSVRAALFPESDPTLREAVPATVRAITLDDLDAYRRAAIRPDLTVIVVIGKVTPERAKAVIEKHFGAWTATGPEPDTVLPKVPPSRASVTQVPDASRVQDRVTLAETVGLTRSNPDFYALRLGNTVLSGASYASRFSRDIREQAGLVYSIDSFLEAGPTRAVYFIEYACEPANVSRVQDAVVRELEAMRATPVTADELHRAKALLLRRIPLDEASVHDIAEGYIERWRLDLPLDEPMAAARHYLALDAAAVRAAFAQWVRPDALSRISQGPPAS